ncbi:MAG: tetratricopeptide repeat protein [Rhodospirillaceae bacterium]|nr:tetratricopeptide repeat protein [Rhodospirillaceae bacterium]
MAYFERDNEPRERSWRDLILSLAAVATLAAGLLLGGCVSSIPDVAQLFKEVTTGKQTPSDENLVNKGFDEIEAGNYAYAEIYLDSALSINPSNPFALLNMGVVYENTGREDEARAIYAMLIRQKATNLVEASSSEENIGRTVTDIASANLAALDRDVIARAARNTESPIEVPLAPERQNLESDWRVRMDERISILQDLYSEGFVSEDELMARLGGAWSRSHSEASPSVSEIANRLETLESLLQRGMISPEGYAMERSHVLDALAPMMAMPEGLSPKSAAQAGMPADAPPAATSAQTAKMAQTAKTPKTANINMQDAPKPAADSETPEDGTHVHLASYRSEKDAERGWKSLKKRHEDLLGELSSRVNEVDLGAGKGIYFRVEAGPISNLKSAEDLCKKLKSRKMFCTVTS